MIYQPFQHTEPTHVYRTKQRRMAVGTAIMLSCMTILLIFWQYSHTFSGVPLWGFVVINFYHIGASLNQAFRQKLVISPAGVSITHLWRTAATPWSTVAGSQIFTTNLLGLKTHMPSLVLYSPPVGKLSFYKAGIPAELHDRVLPILFRQWERPNEIEQGLRHYLSQREDGGLLVPYGFAAVPDPNEKRNIIIGLIVGVLVASFMYAFWF